MTHLAVCIRTLGALAFLAAEAVAADVSTNANAALEATPPRDVVPLDDKATFELDDEVAGFPDPWETTNRKTLWLDQQLDTWIISPLVTSYQFLVPTPARHALHRFCLNLDTPAIVFNDLLQREWEDAGVTTGRFLVNTTVGLGGLFDPAVSLGLERHHADFGQTLALAGVDSGPYLIMPLFGPTTVRDASGSVVDFFLQPLLYVVPFAALFIYEGSSGLSVRETHDEGLDALRTSSVDYYAALHNAYSQTRMAEIWDRRAAHRKPTPIPVAAVATH